MESEKAKEWVKRLTESSLFPLRERSMGKLATRRKADDARVAGTRAFLSVFLFGQGSDSQLSGDLVRTIPHGVAIFLICVEGLNRVMQDERDPSPEQPAIHSVHSASKNLLQSRGCKATVHTFRYFAVPFLPLSP